MDPDCRVHGIVSSKSVRILKLNFRHSIYIITINFIINTYQ